MNNMNEWISHLQHPLVLAGFGLFVFALIIRPLFLNSKKLTGPLIAPLLRWGMILLFILAAMAMIGGIALNWKNSPADEAKLDKAPAAQPGKEQENPAAAPEQGNSLSITASGQGEVAIGGDLINTDGNVEKNDAQ